VTRNIIVNKTAQRDKKTRAKARNGKQRIHCSWGFSRESYVCCISL